MRFRAAAVVLALAAAVAIGQVPMYSDYPWGLLQNGTDQGPVWNLNCVPPLWCTVPTYGNGQVQLGDGGVLPVRVSFADDAGQALLAGFADYAADAGLSNRAITSDFAADAGFSLQSGLAVYALDAGLAGRSFTADFANDAGFAIFAGDAGRAYLSNFSDFAADAGYSQSAGLAGVATYALDAGLASKAVAADFARDAGSAASADLATAALWAGDAGYSLNAGAAALATYALDAGLSAKAIAADFARDAGSAASADLSTYALDAGNVQCTGCIDTTRLGSGAVTTAKLADLAVQAAELDDGVPLSAYDEAQPAGIHSRTTATNCTKNTYDGVAGFIRYTIGTATTNPQVSSTLYTGTSTTLATTRAVMRYRLSGGAANKVTAITAINNANTAQTASAVFLADGNWHTAVFDISGWTTAGTLRIDLTLASTLSTTGNWDISYLGTGNPGSGTGALVSYQGAVGIGVATPGAALEVAQGASSGWATQFTNTSTAANTTKTVGLELRGTDTSGTEKQAALVRAVPEDNNYVAAGLSLSTRSADAVAERVAISGAGVVTVNQPAAGFALQVQGTSSPSAAVVNTSNAAATFPSFQVANYGASGGFPVLATYSSRGTSASPGGSSSGDVLGAWIHYGRVSAAFAEGSRIDSVLTAAPGLSALTAALRFYTANGGASTERMRIAANGVVSLPSSGSLQVGNATWTTSGNDVLLNTSGASSVYLRPGGAGSTNWQYEANGASAYHRWLGASGAQLLNLDGSSLTTSVAVHELGPNTDTATYIDLHGAAATYTDYTLRLLHNAGANGTSEIIHRGTGTFNITANESATLALRTAATNRLTISSAGVVTVANLSGTGNRAVYSDAAGALTNTSSDGTLKTAVEDLRAPLRMVLALRPVSFNWVDVARFGDQREIGFIAQEVMQAIPEVVGRNADGTYTVDYPKIVAALAGAVQELYEDRTALAQRVQALEDRAEQAESRLAQLEARMAALEAWSGVAGCPPDCEPAGTRPGNGQRP